MIESEMFSNLLFWSRRLGDQRCLVLGERKSKAKEHGFPPFNIETILSGATSVQNSPVISRHSNFFESWKVQRSHLP